MCVVGNGFSLGTDQGVEHAPFQPRVMEVRQLEVGIQRACHQFHAAACAALLVKNRQLFRPPVHEGHQEARPTAPQPGRHVDGAVRVGGHKRQLLSTTSSRTLCMPDSMPGTV